MSELKLLEDFKRVKEKKGTLYELFSNTILVSKLPIKEVVSKGGIIAGVSESKSLNSIGRDFPQFCYVLDYGPGYYDEAGNITQSCGVEQ